MKSGSIPGPGHERRRKGIMFSEIKDTGADVVLMDEFGSKKDGG